MPRFLRLLAAITLAILFAAPVFAEPLNIAAGGGQVALPMTGLSVILPAQGPKTYAVSGRWFLTGSGGTFDSRDTIDEFDATGKLIAGTWVSAGYFSDGSIETVVKNSTLLDAWNDSLTMWGQKWFVQGGNYDFQNSLGVKPAAVIGMVRDGDSPALLVDIYFVDATGPLSKEQILARLPDMAVAHAAFDAYTADRTAPSKPTKSANVTPPTDASAVRTVHLPILNRDLRLPDDGLVWLEDRMPAKDATSDTLFLMAPSLPDTSLEILSVDAVSVDELYSQLDQSMLRWDPAPANIPAGWLRGATLLDNGTAELTIARAVNGKVTIIGFVQKKVPSDLAPFQAIAAAIAAMTP